MRLTRTTCPAGAAGDGIVHLGIGAFHRAHQAVYTENAGGGWGIVGVSERSRDVVDRLAPQDGLYSVLVRGPDDTAIQVIRCVRDVMFAGADPRAVVAAIADPATRIVSLTVTEKGYHHDPATRRLRVADPEIAEDAAGRPPRTPIGQLARGLAARARADPITIVCCDNIPSNGPFLRGLVEDFCSVADIRPADDVAFPATMVDRIVPATTDADRAAASRMLGLRDEAVVVTEPFTQWVIEDSFASARPDWQRAGAIITGDVASYETMKLRLLNGSHSMIAYLGALAGFRYISGAIGPLAGVVDHLMAEVTPTLAVPDGFDLAGYKASLMERFANPALEHRTIQVAMDGSQKLPQRLLAAVRERRSDARWTALAVAGWMRHVWARTADDGTPLPLDDPMADRLSAAVADARTPSEVADALFAIREIFGVDVPVEFRQQTVDWLAKLTADGVMASIS